MTQTLNPNRPLATMEKKVAEAQAAGKTPVAGTVTAGPPAQHSQAAPAVRQQGDTTAAAAKV